MRFSTSTVLVVLSTGLATALDFCPAADGLFFYGRNGNHYQVQCGIEYFTQTNLKSSTTADPIACAADCEAWTRTHPRQRCSAGSWEISTGLCFLKPADLGSATKRQNPDVITTLKI